jgi:hypothetical protein
LWDGKAHGDILLVKPYLVIVLLQRLLDLENRAVVLPCVRAEDLRHIGLALSPLVTWATQYIYYPLHIDSRRSGGGRRQRSRGELFEYACHEGNYGLRGILSAMRAEEASQSAAAAR